MAATPADPVLHWRADLRVEVAGDDRVFLVGEREQYLLEGRAHALAAPLVDGRRTVMEIVRALEGAAPAPEVFHALTTLQERRYAVEGRDPPFWEAAGVPGERLRATPVAVRGAGADPAPMIVALEEAGLTVAPEAALTVVVTDDYLCDELAAWNRRALDDGTRWLPVKPVGLTAWIGPLFGAGGRPCWSCLAARLRTNRAVQTFVEREAGRPASPPVVALPATAGAAARLAAVTLAGWIAAGGGDRLYAVTFHPLAVTEHAVVPRPQCPACGDPGWVRRRVLAPVTPDSRRKTFREDGGHRTVSPEATLARLERQVSPLTGVVARVGPIPGRDHPLRPIFAATYFIVPASEAPASGDFVGVAFGKGRSAAQSRAGALCEAIERSSAIAQGDEPLLRASLVELGPEAIDPAALQGFSAAQLADREAINARVRDRRRMVPLPFDPEAAIDWVPAWSLTGQCRRYLPAAYAYVGAGDQRFCLFNPNGHAAGNCLEEAILQGALELAERDAVAIWWYGRVPRPAVELDQPGFPPYFQVLVRHYAELGHDLWVLDLTNDLRIPAFAALARDRDTARYCVGFGAHFDAVLAVQRALTELGQVFDPALPPPWDPRAIADPTFLLPGPGAAVTGGRAAPDDLRDDIDAFVARAAEVGLETIVLDQTRPDTGLAVVQVVVPGLRHFWPRLGPGRLYEVPVRLGWLERPRREDELNPVPLFV